MSDQPQPTESLEPQAAALTTHAEAVAAIFARMSDLDAHNTAEIAAIKSMISGLPALLSHNVETWFASLKAQLTSKSG